MALAGAAAAFLITLVVVLFLLGPGFGGPDEWVLTVGPSGDLAEVTMGVGDCADVDPFEARRLDEAAAVPCDGVHRLELIAREQLTAPTSVLAAPSPLDDAVLDTADRWCLTTFEMYVDANYHESVFDYLTLVPDEGRWRAGEREVLCLVVPWDQPSMVGSVRGSQR